MILIKIKIQLQYHHLIAFIYIQWMHKKEVNEILIKLNKLMYEYSNIIRLNDSLRFQFYFISIYIFFGNIIYIVSLLFSFYYLCISRF